MRAGLWLLDSIVDGLGAIAVRGPFRGGAPRPSCPLHVERSTLLGRTRVRSLDAQRLDLRRRGDLPAGSRRAASARQLRAARLAHAAPLPLPARPAVEAALRERRRHEPQPDETERGASAPRIEVARRAGLHLDALRAARRTRSCASARRARSRAGAEDGSELGAFSHLKQPQRESNLRIRLDEYLPFGLEPGLIYVT